MSLDVLEQKKLIAIAAEYAVSRIADVSLIPGVASGASYPYAPDVPGIWVRGPDGEGRFSVEIYVLFESGKISGSLLDESKKLRSVVWAELRKRKIDALVGSVDIFVEDVNIAV